MMVNKYLSFAHAITDNESTRLIDIVDVDRQLEEDAKTRWEVDPQDKNKKCDLVIIATPDAVHNISLYQALLFDPQLVLCEKPICTMEEYPQIEEIYNFAGIPIMVDYTRRFLPRWQQIKSQINEYGDFVGGWLYYNRGTEHTASHFVDLCRWFGVSDTDIISKIRLTEVDVDYRWVFDWTLIYSNGAISEKILSPESADMKISDNATQHVLQHAVNWLDRKTNDLICTGKDAFDTLQGLWQCKINKIIGGDKHV